MSPAGLVLNDLQLSMCGCGRESTCNIGMLTCTDNHSNTLRGTRACVKNSHCTARKEQMCNIEMEADR